jgi:hypothetical protein
MLLSEYFLLAMLASGGAALPGTVPNTTLDADAIVQPDGGALSSVYRGQWAHTRHKQAGQQKEFRTHSKVTHHPRKQPRVPKKDGGKSKI